MHDLSVRYVVHVGVGAVVAIRAATANIKIIYAAEFCIDRVGMPLHQDCHTSWLPLSARLQVLRATCVWRRPAMPRAAKVVELPLA